MAAKRTRRPKTKKPALDPAPEGNPLEAARETRMMDVHRSYQAHVAALYEGRLVKVHARDAASYKAGVDKILARPAGDGTWIAVGEAPRRRRVIAYQDL